MKTQVEFRSPKFPPYEGEEQINPGRWGKRLAEYLAKHLAERGIQTDEIAEEDWGCYLPILSSGFRMALCCGHQSRSDHQFLVFTDPSTPTVRKWFRSVDVSAQLSRVLEAVREILDADPDISGIVWSEPK